MSLPVTIGERDPTPDDNDPIELQQETSTFQDSLRRFAGADAGQRSDYFSAPQDSAASRRGLSRPVKRRGPRKAAEPTGDVKLRINAASQAYLEGRLHDARGLLEDAIRINAEIHRAWTLLAQVFHDLGDYMRHLLALVCAAHLQPKIIEGWLHCAQVAIGLRDEHPEEVEELSRTAIHAFGLALRADTNHKAARLGRAAIHLERGSYKLAYVDYLLLLKKCFYDVYALRGLVEAAVRYAATGKPDARGKPEEAKEAYGRCIEFVLSNGIDPDFPFGWEDVYIYVDLLAYLGCYQDALKALKSLARWLLGRQEDDFWDNWRGDDREWDHDDVRRCEVADFVHSRASNPGQRAGPALYGDGLPIQLRAKLAVFRLELAHFEEAMVIVDLYPFPD